MVEIKGRAVVWKGRSDILSLLYHPPTPQGGFAMGVHVSGYCNGIPYCEGAPVTTVCALEIRQTALGFDLSENRQTVLSFSENRQTALGFGLSDICFVPLSYLFKFSISLAVTCSRSRSGDAFNPGGGTNHDKFGLFARQLCVSRMSYVATATSHRKSRRTIERDAGSIILYSPNPNENCDFMNQEASASAAT